MPEPQDQQRLETDDRYETQHLHVGVDQVVTDPASGPRTERGAAPIGDADGRAPRAPAAAMSRARRRGVPSRIMSQPTVSTVDGAASTFGLSHPAARGDLPGREEKRRRQSAVRALAANAIGACPIRPPTGSAASPGRQSKPPSQEPAPALGPAAPRALQRAWSPLVLAPDATSSTLRFLDDGVVAGVELAETSILFGISPASWKRSARFCCAARTSPGQLNERGDCRSSSGPPRRAPGSGGTGRRRWPG